MIAPLPAGSHGRGGQGAQSSPPQPFPGVGALDDLLVVDLSRALAGPYATMLLADLGARVIKVERPGSGDDTRSWGPPFVGPPGAMESTYYLSANRNKESIVLDLKAMEDRLVLERLVKRADVVVENFRPRALERLGLGHDRLRAVNPRLVILSISGFGPDGPEASRPGYDQIVQGEAGLMSLTGEDSDHPTRMGVPISDLLTGIFGALGVVSALHQRTRTGEGQVVTTSLLASSVAAHSFQGARWLLAGEMPRAGGNHHPTLAPYGAFRCQDGIIQVAVGNDGLWRAFALLVGLNPEDPRFENNAQRHANRDTLTDLIERRLRQDSAEHWLARLEQAGVPAGEIKTLDRVYGSPQVLSQRLVIETDHPSLGRIRLPGSAIRLERGMRRRHQAPPMLGEQTAAVLEWLDQPWPGERAGTEKARAGTDLHDGSLADQSSRKIISAARSARELLEILVDPGTFVSWDRDVVSTDPLVFDDLVGYPDRLEAARSGSGTSESVITGQAAVEGYPVAVVVSEPGFIAGTMGVVAGERIAAALERAGSLGLPVVAVAASGGARMQEGPLALAQMAKTAAAVRRYRDGGGCLITYLAHPTMGGVLASWGSLGSFQFAMPGALIGYAGPRSVKAITGHPLPPDAQLAETLLNKGLLDDVFPVGELRSRVSRILAVLTTAPPAATGAPSTDGLKPGGGTAWEAVLHSRDEGRHHAREIVATCTSDFTALQGDGVGGGDDPSCLAGICLFLDRPVALVAQVHGGHGPSVMVPAGFRKARRLFHLAEELGLPVVCLIDTPGPELSSAAEAGGLAREIAATLADFSALTVPTVSALIGQGGGGGAIAFLGADRVIASDGSWLAPIAPEAAAAILYRTTERAAEVAVKQHIGAWDLAELGILDQVVPEAPLPGSAEFPDRPGQVIASLLSELALERKNTRLARRATRYRGLGSSFICSKEDVTSRHAGRSTHA